MPDLRPSSGALLRLIHWPRAILRGGALLILAYFVFQQEWAWISGLPLPEGSGLWLAVFFVSNLAGLALSMGSLDDLLSSVLASMLPALDAGLRRGLAVLAAALGVAAGLTGLFLGLDVLQAMALASFSASVFVLSICAAVWAIRVESPALWPMLAFGVPSIPLLTWILAPALPGRLGAAEPLATVAIGLMLSVALLRLVPLLPPRGLAGEGEEGEAEAGEADQESERSSPSAEPLPAGAWVQAPVWAGLRFWWLELSGRQLASGRRMAVVYPLLGFSLALVAAASSHWLFLVFLLVGARVPPVPAPLGAFPIPVGRMERARIAWTADLLQTAALLAGAAGFLLLAPLVSPDRFMAVSGPHPALVLAALAVSLSMNGALNAVLGVKGSSPKLGRHIFSMLLLIALAIALIRVVELSPPVAAWPLLLAAGVAGPAAAYLLFRRHLARCPLGPDSGSRATD